ncbi:15121_t:CDS:10 [Acaulospora morrowiae]|uniref:RNA polymerase II-associated protein 3 n=1 Tax=Acaulospora morrowiae TaxID=94023 RepID=A0A9N9BSL1_9GLOM|nr:15121_t:CDS:10 [Acaulospora morrowiae]
MSINSVIKSRIMNTAASMSLRQTDRKGKKTLRIEQALKEKEMGNAFFKKGNYTKAIDHYGKAMELDPKEAVFVINRAMAYLKLKKWIEAENDCTRGLLLHPDNVKALWRRGIARREMGKLGEAKKGGGYLEDALKLEPNEDAINEEYSRVMDALKMVRKDEIFICAASTPPTPLEPQAEEKEIPRDISASDTAKTNADGSIPRRRLTVEEVEIDEDEHIIESAKKLQITKKEENESKQELPVSTRTIHQKIDKPRTMIEFERDWNRYQSNDEELYNFIKVIPPDNYSTLFSEFFGADHLSRIIVILKDFFLTRNTNYKSKLSRDSVNDVYDILYHLSRVERFDIILMFLENKDRQVLEEMFRTLIETSKNQQNGDKQKLTNVSLQEVVNLTKAYGIKGL